jgi:hypothetical protein
MEGKELSLLQIHELMTVTAEAKNKQASKQSRDHLSRHEGIQFLRQSTNIQPQGYLISSHHRNQFCKF